MRNLICWKEIELVESVEKIDKTPRALLCGAKTRRNGTPCRGWGMPNGRCWLHGGKSTGPKTPEGLERSRKSSWKHGRCSAQAINEQMKFHQLRISARKLLSSIEKGKRSLTPDELSVKLNELRQLGDNIEYMRKNFKFLTTKDLIHYYKYFLMELNTFHVYTVSVLSQMVPNKVRGRT
jgi:hypothetical protein